MVADPPRFESLVGLLHQCRHSRDQRRALQLLAFLRQHRLDTHLLLANHLIPALVDCDCLHDAQLVFDRFPRSNEHSWSSLIYGYIDHGTPHHAFALYHQMRQNHIPPSNHTYVALLRGCSALYDIDRGRSFHEEIIEKGLEKDAFLGNVLVDLYGRCSSLLEVRHVFQSLPARDRVSWNSLLTCYVDGGLGEEALHCLDEMQLEGAPPDAITVVCSLKACGIVQAIERGHMLCAEIFQKGLELDALVGSTMVDMYAKCCLLVEAQNVLIKLPIHNVVSWTALISAYAENGLEELAWNSFEEMHVKSILSNEKTFACILKACGNIGSAGKGQGIHLEIIERGLEKDLYVGNALVDMYTKCGLLEEACGVFDGLLVQDGVSWAALIAGYTNHGRAAEAFTCTELMQQMGMSLSGTIFLCVLKACGSIGAIERGQGIHDEAVKKGLEQEVPIGCTLVSMYGKCGLLIEAHQVFRNLPMQHAVAWNALLVGYCEFGTGDQVLSAIEEMQVNGICKDVVALICSLKACNNTRASENGFGICSEIVTKGLERDLSLGTAMVDMFSKFGLLGEANRMFEKMLDRDTVSCNALVLGYADNGCGEEALSCYQRMHREGILPNAITFVSALKASGSIGALEKGQEVFTEIIEKGLESEIYNGNPLVNMYAKCGSLVEARAVFDMLGVQDGVSWAALIAGYSEHGFDEDVLNCLKEMELQDVSVDVITIARCLHACATIGALETGKAIHAKSSRLGCENDLFVSNTLIDMYGKCGLLAEAQEVFDKLPTQDVVSWGALIKAYAENHKVHMAVQSFKDMQEQGVKPDAITFTCLLAACCQSTQLLKGEEYFEVMKEHEIKPTLDHYTCMVDLLARSGHFSKAEKLSEALECLSSKEVRTALLSACKLYGKVEVGLRCFDDLVQANKEDASAYLLMVDIFTSAAVWVH